MTLRRSIVLSVIVITVIVISCNVLKKEESNESIQAFVNSFQSSLALSDEAILKQFDAKQSSESILAAVRILQNKDSQYFECVASFQNAVIHRTESDTIMVIVPAVFNAKNLDETVEPVVTSFTLSLLKKKNEFTIVILDAEAFYNSYASLKNGMEWSVQRQEALDARVPIYQKVKDLQAKYDSVIWFTTYNEKNYFYVVKGEWKTNDQDATKLNNDVDYLMGLVDDSGAVIVPLEYDLVGTIGFDFPSVVEVRKDGKYGYFNIESGQRLLEPVYDLIVPYGKDNIPMVARKDSVDGWINNKYEFTAGLPTASVNEWFNSLGFLPANLMISAETRSLCEIPNQEYAGSGVFVPPSYLVKTGMFDEVHAGMSTTKFPLNGWTEYIETEGTILEKISDTFTAVITTINERYLEGREEFYTHNRMVFVNSKNDSISIADNIGGSYLGLRRVNDSLIEVKSLSPYYNGDMGEESEVKVYSYFLIQNGTIAEAATNRTVFPASQFVKLDSSYLTGKFELWNPQVEQVEYVDFMPLAGLENARDEILADYGYIFPDGERQYNKKWYSPRYNTREEFQDQLTDIDKYNLEFLDRLIEMMKTTSA